MLDASGRLCNAEEDGGGVTGVGRGGSGGVSMSEEARRRVMPATMKVRRMAVYSTCVRIVRGRRMEDMEPKMVVGLHCVC